MIKLSKVEIGTISEHQAIVNLTKKGYMVAKACSPQCLFDLVAVNPNGKIKLLDVKTKSFRKKDNYKIDFHKINNLFFKADEPNMLIKSLLFNLNVFLVDVC